MPRRPRQRSAEAEALTRVVLSIFRANGLLLDTGNELASSQRLTSATWQVLGAVSLAGVPLTVPQIGRRMGLTRQSVHATARRLVAEGLLSLVPNADHSRSQLVELTPEGRARYAAVDAEQIRWSNAIAATLCRSELETTTRTLDDLCTRLEAGSSAACPIASPETPKGRS
jgi:DNA-binding MarR family transcriptional regulator